MEQSHPGSRVLDTVPESSFRIYQGTSNWDGVCASGNKQSPINFVPEETVAVYRRVLRFNGAQQIPHSTNITNSGHSIKIKLRTQKPITVTGGVFGNKVYEFQQLHFHWGRNVNEGSEHTTNSKRYPLEAHLVFYKADAKDPTTAPDGMAVLGVQYDVSVVDTDKFISFMNRPTSRLRGFFHSGLHNFDCFKYIYFSFFYKRAIHTSCAE
uniref:carbonic anhydrase n=1 Tax=Lygus hesperus TaxID=30085 RepID=A0A146LW74_LYGHE